MFVILVATMVRAAISKISAWRENYDLLVCNDDTMISQIQSGKFAPDHKDSIPYAVALRDAPLGFPSHPLLKSVLPKIIQVVGTEFSILCQNRFFLWSRRGRKR